MITYVNGKEDTRVTGANTIFFKDGFNIGAHANASRQFYGRMEDIRIYDHALTAEELHAIALAPFPKLELAVNPNPVNGETDAPRDVELNWTPGEGANQHDVYFGINFDDVNNASTTDDPASVYMGQQVAATYSPGLLEFGQTYYWRVDEVKTVDGTVSKGTVWAFTTEPVGYALPGELIAATASSSADPNGGPENTINGSGLDDNDLHSVEQADMWLSSSTGPQPTWIEFQFDRIYKLHEMQVWNHNSFLERVIGFGIKDATVEYSVDGASWTIVGTTHEFARADSAAGYAANTIVDLSGVVAKYVKITANSNWGSLPQYGLSEVRFLYVPKQAREPDPASGAKDIDVDNVTLRWRAGREAVTHNVYFSDDQQAVIDGTAPVETVTETNYGPLSLDLGKTYYWKVNEVNESETIITWEGNLWSFTTVNFIIIDDMESYNDIEEGEPGSNRIYVAWVDGYNDPTNGSQTGHLDPPFYEENIVNNGNKSMPIYYDNAVGKSEATLTLTSNRDWTIKGVDTLTIWFRGDVANTAENLYVALNTNAVVNHDNPDAALTTAWTAWNINLQSFADQGVNLANVNSITLGLSSVTGGTGIMYFDDIRLYPPAQ
jgi:hypothetical protein